MGQPQSANTVIDKAIESLERDIEAHKRQARQHRELAASKSDLCRELRSFYAETGSVVRFISTEGDAAHAD